MANEIELRNEKVVSLIDSRDLGDIIKPLFKYVFLIDTYIAGTTHIEDESILDALSAGEELTLQREDNRFDENAILTLNGAGEKLGYIPEKDNTILARLMDAGKQIKAKVKSCETTISFRKIAISVYLVDL